MLKKLLLFSVLLFAFEQAVNACSCPFNLNLPEPQTSEEIAKRDYESADAVFYGKVTKVEEYNSRYSTYKAKFKVNRAWKFVESEEVIIYAHKPTGANCGVNLEVGKSYLIYAQKSQGKRLYPIDKLYTDECLWGSQNWKFFGEGYKPKKNRNN